MARPVIFSTSTCSWCRRAKRYLKDQRVPFEEINVGPDPEAARNILRKAGQTVVPVIWIGVS